MVLLQAKLSLALRASESPFFACAKKGNRKKHTPVVRLPGILPSRFASALRGSLNVRPCTCSELARIVRAILRTFPSRARRTTGAPLNGFLPQKRERANVRVDAVQGRTDSLIERRRPGCRASQPGRDKPAGARRWIAALAKQYTDVLSEQPRPAEKRRAIAAPERCKHRVRRLAFLVTFWAMSKSNPRSGAARKLCR